VIVSGATRVAGVIGAPIRQSLSPPIHNAAFAACGLDWVFTAFEVAPGAVPDALVGMKAFGLGGLSVTMPHKADVADAVDVLSPAAERLHAVNTVVPRPDGGLEGHNTDGSGFLDSLAEAGVEIEGRRCVVVGAGGAARALVLALADAEAADVAVVNRTARHAEVAAALAGNRGRVGTDADISVADLVVNATSVGMGSPDLPFDPALLVPGGPGRVVADIVVHPLDTALLQAARRAGATTVDGLGMLVHQAARAFTMWTGHDAPVAVMRQAARIAVEARAG
jgi:shikimate dehydrogenase